MHTEEAAAFDSCSAYHSSPEILFLSHCSPFPPDKGERIRAHWLFEQLARRFRIHLVCFAKSAEEEAHAREMAPRCASLHVERLNPALALAKAALSFASGSCLTTSYYATARVRRHIQELCTSSGVEAVFCYSSAMAPLAPSGVPVFLDFVDMDSEKLVQYSDTRQPALAYLIEALRLRRIEAAHAKAAVRSFVATGQELRILRSLAPGAHAEVVENGVDFRYFDPAAVQLPPELAGKHYVLFTGVMSYFPNVDGVKRFAETIFPRLRARDPRLEFLIVGRNPSKEVRALGQLDGITVTGSVPDIRPYVAGAKRVVVPLEIARGIQNKVLEALAMGKPVLCSPAVFHTFGDSAPLGASLCRTAEDYAAALDRNEPLCSPEIRSAASARFYWKRNLEPVVDAIEFSALERRAVHAI
ncbi:MAG: TIGR03087 family PEP-CTERM/XrtA system glycosyltransferase [Acidobacteriaceae bacterium]|nr:TIGR03087 family PEP-CTERM/XrtA system glycosyltransferase [Acidobacteriaceae bacterium]